MPPTIVAAETRYAGDNGKRLKHTDQLLFVGKDADVVDRRFFAAKARR